MSENPNTNCLEGMQCPECESYGPFVIGALAFFTHYDEGSDDCGDLEWDGDSYCRCDDCGHEAQVIHFREDRDAYFQAQADSLAVILG